MNEVPGSYQRWRAADESGRDDDADWAFKTVFRTVVPDRADLGRFHEADDGGLAAAAARDARRARYTRAAVVSGAVVGGAAAVYFGTGWAISFLSTVFVGFLNLVIAVIVRGARRGRDGCRVLGGDGEPRPCRGGVCGGSEGDGCDPRDPGGRNRGARRAAASSRFR